MRCTRPKTIALRGTFSCGKCPGCRARKAREWEMRFGFELNKPDIEGWFNTLTIDDNLCGEFEPYNLNKRMLQLYHKRLQKMGIKFKYLSTGEYGGAFGRAHYHEIIAVESKTMEYNCFEKAWQYGFVKSLPAERGAIRYILKYMDKDRDVPAGLGFQKPFQIQSINIGKDRDISRNMYLEKGREFIWPRYYRKLKYGDDKKAMEQYLKPIIIHGWKNDLDKIRKISYNLGSTKTSYNLMLDQIEANLKAQQRR